MTHASVTEGIHRGCKVIYKNKTKLDMLSVLQSCLVLGLGEGWVYKEEGIWGGKPLPPPYPGVGGAARPLWSGRWQAPPPGTGVGLGPIDLEQGRNISSCMIILDRKGRHLENCIGKESEAQWVSRDDWWVMAALAQLWVLVMPSGSGIPHPNSDSQQQGETPPPHERSATGDEWPLVRQRWAARTSYQPTWAELWGGSQGTRGAHQGWV